MSTESFESLRKDALLITPDTQQGPVTGLQCLPGEPILVTSSPDNTVKQWIFDLPDGGGRLLRHKEGHSQPPLKIRFYGNLGHNILSACKPGFFLQLAKRQPSAAIFARSGSLVDIAPISENISERRIFRNFLRNSDF